MTTGSITTGSITTVEQQAVRLPLPEERGTLEVHPSVVRKVAEWAADLTPGTVPTPGRLARLGAGPHGASARIDGAGDEVEVALSVALRYPAPIRELADAVRRAVTQEIQRITGYRVRSVQLTVSALLPDPRPRVE